MARQDHSTKWTAEFLVASELSRRQYQVVFTSGSLTPGYDILVASPRCSGFKVDVKGMATKGVWLVTDKMEQADLFYILVFVPVGPPASREKDEIFVLTQTEVSELLRAYRKAHPGHSSKFSQFAWKDALPHRDCWDKLPGGSI